MPTSTSDLPAARAVDVKVTDDELAVQLEDGRTLAVPLVWLSAPSPRQQARTRAVAIHRTWSRHSLARAGRGHQR